MKKCSVCGYEGKEKLYTKGTLLLEIGLWILGLLTCGLGFLIALPYSIWRLCSRYKGCPNCGNPHMFKPLNQKEQESDEEDFW